MMEKVMSERELEMNDRLFVVEDKIERIYMALQSTVNGVEWGTIAQMQEGLLAINRIIMEK